MACLLAWASDTVLGIVANYVQQGVSAAIHQLRYMCCLKKYEEELNQEGIALNVVQQEVERILRQEAKSTNVPDEAVEDWVKRTKKAMEDTLLLQNAIKEDKRCFCNWCPNWFWRHGRSKEAEGLTTTLKRLQEDRGKFTKLTHEATELPNIDSIRCKGIQLSKASESALHDIMVALETDGINVIGLHGMPGVGKTTLAIQVTEEAKRRRLFQEFVTVTVREKPNMNAIQERIAEELQLKFDKESSMRKRASKLMLRLQDKNKKLLVLDDVWGELSLNEIGISMGLNNCKILLTTRRVPVCESMNCQRKILLDILTEDEAWSLFKTAANLEDDSPLTVVAKMVAKECGRLPVAIVSVGKALRGKPHHGWERASKKLQEGEHQEIRDLSREENAYRSLKFSFDELHKEETKRCLLFCSLFPEDHEICVEDLTRYAHGLGLYRRARSIEDTMSEVLDALDELQDSHLLLAADKRGHVQMHDLVRDIVILIGRSYSAITEQKTEKKFIVDGGIGFEEWPADGSFRDCAAISMLENEIGQLPNQLDSPNLEMLLLARRAITPEGFDWPDEENINIPDKSFEGTEKLQVLSVTRGILSIQSLQNLTNLHTLELRYCTVDSNGIALLGNLRSLEILSFYGSDIDELPDEIGELKNLKLLELTNCYSLEHVPPNMLRKLSKLEELHIGTFEEWDEGTGNASLMDIHRTLLPHLAVLSLTYRQKIPQDFAFSNLIGYHIHICECEYPSFQSRLRYPATRTICIVPNEDVVNACKNLFTNVYDLSLECSSENFRNMVPDMCETGFQDLSRLFLHGCEVECLVSTSKKKTKAKGVFSNLTELEIHSTNLTEICEGQPPEGFLEKLQTTTIMGCDQMMTIFPEKLLCGMKKLESVTIKKCEILQEVFQLDGLDEANMDCLSHLTKLELSNLDALTCIWKGPTNVVKLNSLTQMTIYYCDSLKYLFSVSLARSLAQLEKLEVHGCNELEYIITEEEDETISESHTQQLYLQNLKSLEIEKCHRLKYVFPITMALGLLNLTKLYIKACNQLVAMFRIEDLEDRAADMEEIVFPKLLNLHLEELPSFLTFCPTGYHFIFSSLQMLTVKGCLQMTTGFNSAPDASVHAKTEPECKMECLVSTSNQKTKARGFFQNMAELEIGATNLIEICEGQPPEGFLEKLQTLKIMGSNRMVTVFPAKLLQGIKKLENVMIKECKILQEVFQLDEACGDCLSHLSKLELHSLDSLTCIWKGPTHHVKLNSLTQLTIHHCKSLKYVFSVSLAQGLAQLEKLEVHGCNELEHIVTEKEGPETFSETHNQQLCLRNLKSVEIEECHQLKYVFSVSLAQGLGQLEKLEVHGCNELEYIITEKKGSQTFSETHTQQLCLRNLKSVEIEGCHQLKYAFPIAMARGLLNLANLRIKSSNQLVAIFRIEDQEDTAPDIEEIVFPKLLELYLEEIPSLGAFCPTGYHFIFSSLQLLTVKGCLQMKTSFYAAPDASVCAKPESQKKLQNQEADYGKATTQVMFALCPTDNVSEWICSEGQWILRRKRTMFEKEEDNEDDEDKEGDVDEDEVDEEDGET